jgi:Putative binding domain, N-terminal/Viral BACON domain
VVAQPRRGFRFLARIHLKSSTTATGEFEFSLGADCMHKGDPPKRLTYIGVCVLACALAACGSTVATSTGPSPTKCALTLAVPAAPISSAGDTAMVGVTTQPECTWSASSDASWITGLTPSSGQGSAQLQMQVATNPDGVSRQGDIMVNDQRARILQDAAACRFELSATEQTIAAGGGTGRIPVTAPTGCAWSARTDAAWVRLTSGTTGTGSGSVAYTIGSNAATTTRSASIVVAGQTVKVTQPGIAPVTSCSVTVSPRDVTFSASGANSSSISVTADPSCAWAASSDSSWISLTGPRSGTGNGTVTFGIASNTGAARSGELTIGDKTVAVNQLATMGACSYTVTPLTVSISAAGSTGTSVSVASSGTCAWTAASGVSWISIASGGSGSGNGSVTIGIAANSGAARSGTLTVAGQTVTVNQAAASCSYSVTPTTVSINAAGGVGTPISVTTGSGCTWTATTSAGWITIVTGATGTGNGSVTYSVQANTGSARSGTLTVAGRNVSISQTGLCSYSISPHDHTIDKDGGTGTVSVNTQSGCAWTAVSNASWITITNGASGTDDGSVKYAVEANTTGNNRVGTLTIAGQTFTLTEKK